MRKRILAIFLSLFMILGILPTTAWAAKTFTVTIQAVIVNENGGWQSTNALPSKNFSETTPSGSSYNGDWQWSSDGNGYKMVSDGFGTNVNAFGKLKHPTALWDYDTSEYEFIGIGKYSYATDPAFDIDQTILNSSYRFENLSFTFTNATEWRTYIFREKGTTPTTPPEAPDDDDLNDILDNSVVTVDCTNSDASHDDKTYGLIKDGYTLPSAVTGNATDGWTYVITLVPSAYVAQYNTDIAPGHTLDPSTQTESITLTWDEDNGWTKPTSDLPVTFTVKCETPEPPSPPEAPGDEDLKDILGNSVVTVDCTNSDASHDDKTYGLIKDGYTLPSAVTGNATDGWTYVITLVPSAYVAQYNTDIAPGHTLDPSTQTESITLTWDEDNGWTKPTSGLPVTFTVKCTTASLTYDANGGTFGGQDTFTVSGISATENYELGKEPSYTAPTRAGMVFMGWTTDESAKNEVYAAGEEIPDLVTTVKIPDITTVYAVWGEDENGDGTADALQIVITPADITVYAGGAGYDGVVKDQNGNLVADSESTSTGLPEPGYYFTLPYELDQYLKGQFGTATGQPVNLAQHIRLQDKTDTSRMWILELYDGAETSSAGGRYIYRLAETATGNSPAKLQISDGNKIVTSDEFFISSSALYQEYQMSLYTGAASQGNIIVELSKDGSQWNDLDDLQGAGTVEGLSLAKGTLTVRGEEENTPTLTTNLGENTTAVAGNNAIANEESQTTITAVVEDLDNATFTINGSNVRTDGQIALYTDGLLPNDVLDNYLKDEGILSDTAQVDYQYLDLVDTSNGNAYVTTDSNVAIYWKLPADADPDDTFYIVHFNGLDRNYDVDDLDKLIGNNDHKVTVYSIGNGLERVEIEGEQYLKFTTSTFSPFALVYDAKDAPQPGDTYTLTYDANALGGTVSGMPNPVTGLSNGSYTLSTARPTHSDVDGTDVVFIGWTETPTTKIFSKDDTAPVTVTTVTINGADETVYAAWGYDVNGNGTPDVEETKYTLTYHANYRGNDDTIEYVYVAGEEVTVKGRLFSRSGYAFDEWNTRSNGRGTSYDRGDVFTMPAHDEDLYAQWTPRGSGDDDDDSYAVYYHPGYGKDVRKLDAFYEVGETVEVLDNEWFQRDDYVFIGWSRTPGGSSPDYLPGDTFKMPSGTVDLYALWEDETSGSGGIDTNVSDWLNTEDHYAYIAGYEDGTVRPEGYLTRAEVATIFFRLLTDEARERFWSTQNSYSDVAQDAWYNNAISTMTKAGILGGYEDNTFRPNNSITRAEFATIAARFLSQTYTGPDKFSDISGHWAAEYINRAAQAGWIGGYADGTYRPNQPITRAEAVTLINAVLGRTPHKDHMLADMIRWPDNPETAWYYAAIQEATNSHDYRMPADRGYEDWTALLPNRDWAALEQLWSQA